MKIFTLIIAVLISNSVIAKQKYYKWTDENGSTHYSTEKPENNETAEINISTNQPIVTQSSNTTEPESEESEEAPEKSYLETRREDKEKANATAAENKQKCLKAKQTVTKYQQQVRMSRIDAKTGEKVFLEDAKREDIIKQANQAVRQYCN